MKKLSILTLLLTATISIAAEPVEIPGTKYKRLADVIYGRKHGVALTMDVIIPPEQNGAAIIYAVSGGFSSHHSWIEGSKFAQQISILLDRGYTVFAVVHGSVPKFTIRETYADIRRAIRYIRHNAKTWNVDPNRFGMSGVSAGGVISLMMGTAPVEGNPKAKDPVDRESTKIQAVACFCPASDLVNFEKEGVNVLNIAFKHRHAECYKFKDYDPKTKVYTLITDEKRIHELLVEHSPITHVTADDAPTLIVHGEKDTLVTFKQQAAPIIDKLKAAGVKAELVVAKDKGHGGINMWQKEVKLITDWFDVHLAVQPTPSPSPIEIETGWEIPSEGYCDQPYVVKLKDGKWLCTMTTGKGHEGQGGQHIVSCTSADKGKTWSKLVDVEPADGPEASWAMPFLSSYGRVYVFYTYNDKNMRTVIGGGKRVDTLGKYAFKYTDDGGKTWSEKRWYIPVREAPVDLGNPYKGKVRFFWGVGKPIRHKGSMYFGFAKIGKFGKGFIENSASWFMCCSNIDSEKDPEKLKWKTLPEGEKGLVSPKGPIAEEVNLTSLSDGSLFCTYRTVAGHPCHAYSRDDGKTWTKTAYMTYKPGGELVKHPRAANFVRKLDEGPYAGRYIYWFHNHGGTSYQGRNPAFLLGGVEKDSPDGKVIHWGKPVAVLYSKNKKVRISYPDFIWDEGLYITETQKTIARVHKIPDSLLKTLWSD